MPLERSIDSSTVYNFAQLIFAIMPSEEDSEALGQVICYHVKFVTEVVIENADQTSNSQIGWYDRHLQTVLSEAAFRCLKVLTLFF